MRISHLGVAVKNLGLSEELFARLLGEKQVHHEEVANQSVRIASIPVGDGLIELTEASNPDSAIAKFIGKRGEGIHHIAFEVDDIVSELARVKAAGFQLIDEAPRMGAHGMLVAFLHPKSTNGVLVELCQAVTSPSVTPHAEIK